ncbi:hypothetical protein OIO90_004906 [Microbotryomycetes sp. JL221]|nr:hypothetical protein OIO90_004906 [Microbotryomycetes sp. JL221]
MSKQQQQQQQQQVGFIGLGNMGSLMSTNLATWLHSQSYPRLMLWNRTRSKLPSEQSNHVQHAESIQHLVTNCDIVFTSLANDEVAQSVYNEMFKHVETKSSKTCFVETSTLFPTTSGQLERQASKLDNVYFCQAPVFGPPPMAEQAKLVWILSGDVVARKWVEPFLVPSMGRKVLDVGSNVEKASAFKLNGNFMVLGMIELLAEGLTLAEKTGVGSELMMTFINEFMPAPSAIGYGNKMVSNHFQGETGFTVEGGLKDAKHLQQLASNVNATVPVIDVAHRHLITARALGFQNKDWSVLVAGPRQAAGLSALTGKIPTPHDTGFGFKTDGDDGDPKLEPVRDGEIKKVQNW